MTIHDAHAAPSQTPATRAQRPLRIVAVVDEPSGYEGVPPRAAITDYARDPHVYLSKEKQWTPLALFSDGSRAFDRVTGVRATKFEGARCWLITHEVVVVDLRARVRMRVTVTHRCWPDGSGYSWVASYYGWLPGWSPEHARELVSPSKASEPPAPHYTERDAERMGITPADRWTLEEIER